MPLFQTSWLLILQRNLQITSASVEYILIKDPLFENALELAATWPYCYTGVNVYGSTVSFCQVFESRYNFSVFAFITASVDDTEIIDKIQLGQSVKVAVDYGRELASSFELKIVNCSLVSAIQSLTLVENSRVHQVHD